MNGYNLYLAGNQPHHENGIVEYERSPSLDISVVIPLYNEQDNIEPLYEELNSVLESLGKSYEVIVVDDGSNDLSFKRLQAVHERDPRWQVVRFRRNFGQTAGLTAGFDIARGEIVITIDSDLQNDPKDIPRLLEKMDEGYDIVSGRRMHRKESFVKRRLPSMIANKLISKATKVELHDYGCTLKAYRREVVKNIELYGELHRFIPAVASWMGVAVTEIPVNDRARRFGTSKYGISRTFRVVLDLITVTFLLKYATKPMHFFGTLGFVVGFVGFLIALYLSYQRLILSIGIADRPLLLLAILMIVLGVNLTCTGLLAEIMMRSYYNPQGKPIYIIREMLGPEESEVGTERSLVM